MSLCTDQTVVNRNSHEGEIHALRCKRWSCDLCNPFNRQEVIHKARKGEPNVFLTLTVSNKNYETPDDAARDLKRSWVLLRRRIFRKWKVKNIPFIAVFEKHKSGWPHMHLLLRAPYLHQRVLTAMWREINGSHKIDIRFIKNKSQIMFYVTKYIGKDLQAFIGCKRFWRSHNYDRSKEDDQQPVLFGDHLFNIRLPFDKALDWLESQDCELKRAHKTKVFFKDRYSRQIPDFRIALRKYRDDR